MQLAPPQHEFGESEGYEVANSPDMPRVGIFSGRHVAHTVLSVIAAALTSRIPYGSGFAVRIHYPKHGRNELSVPIPSQNNSEEFAPAARPPDTRGPR